MTEQAQGATQGRHAMVIPSFIAQFVTKPLDCWVGPVQPDELLDWRRPSDLTEKARQQLRKQIIKRLSPKMARIWPMAPGVALPANWGDHASSRERHLVNETQNWGVALQTASLREIKRAAHLPLEYLFAALARLESINWVPPARPLALARKKDASSQQLNPTPVPMTDALKEKVTHALKLPWLAQVQYTDVRFAYPSKEPICEWLSAQMRATQGWYGLPALVDSLLAADTATAREEIDQLARAWAATYYRRNTPTDKLDAKLKVFDRRYIRPHGGPATLQDAANECSVTRERVRQICEQIIEPWRDGKPCSPAIDRVLSMAADLAPAGLAELNERLRPQLGDGLSLESLCGLSEDIGLAAAVTLHHGNINARQTSVPVRMVSKASDSATWIQATIRYAHDDCGLVGCSSVVRIAGLLALESQVAIPKVTIEAVISKISGFRWLDRASSWFTLDAAEHSSAALRIMKIFAVAKESVSVEEIGAALLDDEEWLQRGEVRAPAIPPQHILRDLLAGWSWLEQLQHTRFAARGPLAADVLNGSELLAIQAIDEHDGVALRREVVEYVLGQSEVSAISVSFMLARCPAIKRIEKNVYSLRGRPLCIEALAAARKRSTQASSDIVCAPGVIAAFRTNVTAASLVNEQYGVPIHARGALPPGTYQLQGDQAPLIVGQAHVIRGLNRRFPHARPGDTFLIESLGERTLRVSHHPSQPAPTDGQSVANAAAVLAATPRT